MEESKRLHFTATGKPDKFQQHLTERDFRIM
jgi:hypothetical protein